MRADSAALAHELTSLVTGIPGVSSVYSARPALVAGAATVLGKTVKILTPGSGAAATEHESERGRPAVPLAAESPVAIILADDSVSVQVRIGVGESESAAEVCRRVYDTIVQHLEGAGVSAPADISVTVARIG